MTTEQLKTGVAVLCELAQRVERIDAERPLGAVERVIMIGTINIVVASLRTTVRALENDAKREDDLDANRGDATGTAAKRPRLVASHYDTDTDAPEERRCDDSAAVVVVPSDDTIVPGAAEVAVSTA